MTSNVATDTAEITHPRKDETHTDIEMASVNEAIRATQKYLLSKQHEEGYWVGVLESDATMPAGYIPLMYFLHGKVDPVRQRKAINSMLSKQLADGSWPQYPGGPGNLDVTIQVYFSLKFGGVSAEEPNMLKARDFVLAKGGIAKANALTKIWLAMFGQYAWRGVPSIPPELIFLPKWLYVNIYEFASWSRETIMAFVLVTTARTMCKVPSTANISELFVHQHERNGVPVGSSPKLLSWKTLFLWADSALKWYDKCRFKPGRRIAMRRTMRWVIDHQERDGSWGGIMLPWIYSLMALKRLGFKLDHPVMAKGIAGLEDFIVEDENYLTYQPSTSPVWDTAWTILALRESGLPPDDPALVKAARWLLKQEIRVAGDWKVKNPGVAPGCWSFEFHNELYPDMDDTSVVPRALLRVQLPPQEENLKMQAVCRGLDWVKAMQNVDGGFAAFDRDNTKQIFSHIPFADFMTPLDPASPDVTAHTLELLSDMAQNGTELRKALGYLRRQQEPDGSWYGRWGVNYVYGTGLTLAGLRAVRQDMEQSYVKRAVSWLESHQNPDGGWGESCQTYDDPRLRGLGATTASQTAWALLGLVASGRTSSASVQEGVRKLVSSQRPDGSWDEPYFTGTGFPRTFYLRYDMYRIYFPLLALAKYKIAVERTSTSEH